MRLLWIDPIGTDAYREPTLRVIRACKGINAEVDFVSLPEGKPLDLEDAAAERSVIPDIVKLVAEVSDRFDGILIGCFFDTGVIEAQKVVDECIVMGPCEATVRLAEKEDGKFSILVGRNSWKSRIITNLRNYRAYSRCASIRSAGLNVHQFSQPSGLTLNKLEHAGRRAVERDRARLLILGCTADTASCLELQSRLNVTVLDAVASPILYLQEQVGLRANATRTNLAVKRF